MTNENELNPSVALDKMPEWLSNQMSNQVGKTKLPNHDLFMAFTRLLLIMSIDSVGINVILSY